MNRWRYIRDLFLYLDGFLIKYINSDRQTVLPKTRFNAGIHLMNTPEELSLLNFYLRLHRCFNNNVSKKNNCLKSQLFRIQRDNKTNKQYSQFPKTSNPLLPASPPVNALLKSANPSPPASDVTGGANAPDDVTGGADSGAVNAAVKSPKSGSFAGFGSSALEFGGEWDG